MGDDQRQHLELARDIAIRFNHRFGETLVVPEATIPPVGARVMDLQNPTAKMSKSADSPQGTIARARRPKTIAKRIKRAVTDSETDVRYDPAEKPGVSNLLRSSPPRPTARSTTAVDEFAGGGYGPLKAAVADASSSSCVRSRSATRAERRTRRGRRPLALGADKAATSRRRRARPRPAAAGLLPRPAGA